VPILVPDRLSLRTVRQDYWRSLRKYGSGRRDNYTIAALVGLPLIAGAVAAYPIRLVITKPDPLIAAVSLLAGVLLAAAGQVVTLRARIADSLTLSADDRVTGMLRETMSGVLLAAVAALFDALLLGVLSVVVGNDHRWWEIALSASVVVVTVFLSLMFVITARRMYSTYLEAFEGGAPLPKTPRKR
jgi:hypothetical protein